MYSKVKIDIEKTKAAYGYDASSFSCGSKKRIIVECLCCHRIMTREFRNRNKLHSCPIIIGKRKRCHRCKEFKDLSLFPKNPKTTGGVGKLCKECHNSHPSVLKYEINRLKKIKQLFREDIERYIKRRESRIRSTSVANGIPYNLNFKFLIDLWRKQDGRCYYTDIKMANEIKTHGFQSWDAPSLDRKNPEDGYVVGNVVWCMFSVNSFKQSLNEEEFKEMIKKIKWWSLQS
jgi:hypothetical protein